MTEIQAQLFNMAQHSATAAELLQDAVCDGCRTCVAQISDLNRQAISDLSELERRHFTARDLSPTYLNAAQTLAACVSQAFSAAMILPDDLPTLPPLADIADCNAQLAAHLGKIISRDDTAVPFYSLHLIANKGRGAHALLLTNYCLSAVGSRLLPLVYALEAHRNYLERACGQLLQI